MSSLSNLVAVVLSCSKGRAIIEMVAVAWRRCLTVSSDARLTFVYRVETTGRVFGVFVLFPYSNVLSQHAYSYTQRSLECLIMIQPYCFYSYLRLFSFKVQCPSPTTLSFHVAGLNAVFPSKLSVCRTPACPHSPSVRLAGSAIPLSSPLSLSQSQSVSLSLSRLP